MVSMKKNLKAHHCMINSSSKRIVDTRACFERSGQLNFDWKSKGCFDAIKGYLNLFNFFQSTNHPTFNSHIIFTKKNCAFSKFVNLFLFISRSFLIRCEWVFLIKKFIVSSFWFLNKYKKKVCRPQNAGK